MRPDAKPAPHADAVSQGGVEVCKGREGGTPAPAGCRRRTRCRTRAGGLAPPCGPSDTCRAHLAASGAVMLGQSGHLGGRVGTGGGRAVAGFGRHLGTRSSGTAGQDGVRLACPLRAAAGVDVEVDYALICPGSFGHKADARPIATYDIIARLSVRTGEQSTGFILGWKRACEGCAPRDSTYRSIVMVPASRCIEEEEAEVDRSGSCLRCRPGGRGSQYRAQQCRASSPPFAAASKHSPFGQDPCNHLFEDLAVCYGKGKKSLERFK